MECDIEIDAIGLLCPLPVLKVRKRLKGLASGSIVKLLTTDPAAQIDVPHFCHEAGHELIGCEAAGEATAYLIRKGNTQMPKQA